MVFCYAHNLYNYTNSFLILFSSIIVQFRHFSASASISYMISLNSQIQTVQHGGDLDEAIKRYGIAKEHWIDLSTGISPWVYPFQPLPEHVWHELPPPNDELLACAAQYYGIKQRTIMATPGSQMTIRLLPQLFQASNVAIPILGYQEHAASWQMANHQITPYSSAAELFELIRKQQVEHVVVINPNNPSGEKFNLDTHEKIATKISGTCIIDEAFIDLYANNGSNLDNNDSNLDENGNNNDKKTTFDSATKILNDHENLIILRSVGKFFGLAGIRLGFAIGLHPNLLALNSLLQPWAISHASQHIGIQALKDTQWQQQQKIHIRQQQNTFKNPFKLLLNNNLKKYSTVESGLFRTVFSDKSALKELHNKLAQQAIWTRFCNENDQNSWLRFGLPNNVVEFEKHLLCLD